MRYTNKTIIHSFILLMLMVGISGCVYTYSTKDYQKRLAKIDRPTFKQRIEYKRDDKKWKRKNQKLFNNLIKLNDSVSIQVKPVSVDEFSFFYSDGLFNWNPSYSKSVNWDVKKPPFDSLHKVHYKDSLFVYNIKKFKISWVTTAYPILKQPVDSNHYLSRKIFSIDARRSVIIERDSLYFRFEANHPSIKLNKYLAESFCTRLEFEHKAKIHRSKQAKKNYNFYYRLPTASEWLAAVKNKNAHIEDYKPNYTVFKINTLPEEKQEKFFYQMNNISEFTQDNKVVGLNYTDKATLDPRNLSLNELEEKFVKELTVERADWLGFRCVCVKIK